MALTVLENAYLKKIENLPRFSESHKRIFFVLAHEKKYCTREELLPCAGYNENSLNRAIKDLEKLGVISVEGWLVRLADYESALL
jgi:predicted HTH transcriptional regulator